MNDCLELLDDIIEIYPVPTDVLSWQTPVMIPASSISWPTLVNGSGLADLAWLRSQCGLVVDSVKDHNSNARTLLIENNISVKASLKQNIAGNYYQVSVNVHTRADISDAQYFVASVDAARSWDTFVVDVNDQVYVVRGVYPATSISLNAVLPLSKSHEIILSSECVNGIQMVKNG